MRERLLDLCVCPRCHAALNLSTDRSEGEEIVSGQLSCQVCQNIFPIIGGIPRLVLTDQTTTDEAQRTVDRFGAQWNEFDFIDERYEKQFLQWIAPVTAEDFAGKLVLEGGCGKGRHSTLAARWGARDVLAIDLGSAVEAAYRNTRAHPNVHVIQADLFQLPVRPRSIDLAFSVGVLHHTPDPAACFQSLVRVVKPGGRVVAWVYGRENNEWIVRFVDPMRRTLTSRLPHRWVYHLAKLPAALLYGVGRGVYQPLSKAPLERLGQQLFYQAYVNYIAQFPFEEIHSIVHDHLTPPIAHYIPKADFENWFADAGLKDVVIGWHNENSWRGTGLVP